MGLSERFGASLDQTGTSSHGQLGSRSRGRTLRLEGATVSNVASWREIGVTQNAKGVPRHGNACLRGSAIPLFRVRRSIQVTR